MLDIFLMAAIAKPEVFSLPSSQLTPTTKELLMTQNTKTIPFTVRVRFLEAYQAPGTYEGVPRLWLRWYDATGNWILSAKEQVEQQLATERAKTERLAARLKQLGINPEE